MRKNKEITSNSRLLIYLLVISIFLCCFWGYKPFMDLFKPDPPKYKIFDCVYYLGEGSIITEIENGEYTIRPYLCGMSWEHNFDPDVCKTLDIGFHHDIEYGNERYKQIKCPKNIFTSQEEI